MWDIFYVLRKLSTSWQVQEYLGPQAEFDLAPLFHLITNNSSKLSKFDYHAINLMHGSLAS